MEFNAQNYVHVCSDCCTRRKCRERQSWSLTRGTTCMCVQTAVREGRKCTERRSWSLTRRPTCMCVQTAVREGGAAGGAEQADASGGPVLQVPRLPAGRHDGRRGLRRTPASDDASRYPYPSPSGKALSLCQHCRCRVVDTTCCARAMRPCLISQW